MGSQVISEIFESRGFLHAFTGGENTDRFERISRNDSVWRTIRSIGDRACREEVSMLLCHSPIYSWSAVISTEHDIQLEDVEEISLTAPPGGLLPLVHSRPVTGLQGKFSAEYTALAAVADGFIKLSSFKNQQVIRPEIQKLLPFVKVSEMEGETKTGQEIEDLPIDVQIKTTSGKIIGKQVWHAPGTKGESINRCRTSGKMGRLSGSLCQGG